MFDYEEKWAMFFKVNHGAEIERELFRRPYPKSVNNLVEGASTRNMLLR